MLTLAQCNVLSELNYKTSFSSPFSCNAPWSDLRKPSCSATFGLVVMPMQNAQAMAILVQTARSQFPIRFAPNAPNLFSSRRFISACIFPLAWHGSRLSKCRRYNSDKEKGKTMLSWSLIFLIVALIAGVLGFVGIAGTAAAIAKVLFVIFLVLFLVSLISGRSRV